MQCVHCVCYVWLQSCSKFGELDNHCFNIKRFSAKVNELASRIIPEGFRVRNATKGNGVMTFIAAEDPMKEEWKQIAASMEAYA